MAFRSSKWILVVGCALALSACGDTAEDEPRIVIDTNNGNNANNTNNANNVNNLNNVNNSNNAVTCTDDADCGMDSLVCNLTTSTCEPVGSAIGNDATPGTVEEVYRPTSPIEAPDLEFHPDRNELWVLNRRFAVEGVCWESDPRTAYCGSLGGFNTIITNPGAANQSAQVVEDQNSWHFMRRPPAMAMGNNGTFATIGEAITGNYEDNSVMYIGPSLWSSDLSIHGRPSGGNGSHLDMLHETPNGMGIAHEDQNIYWVFNGHVGSIDRYDFKMDHGPGNDNHDDGSVHRYIEGELSRVENVPSHMEFNHDDAHLYIADTGNARIVKMDTQSGTAGGPFSPVYEVLSSWGYYNNATFEAVVSTGLSQPSGLALHGKAIYVSDQQTSMIHAYDMQGNALGSIDTGLAAGSLAGIEVDAEGVLWFVDMATGAVFRINR